MSELSDDLTLMMMLHLNDDELMKSSIRAPRTLDSNTNDEESTDVVCLQITQVEGQEFVDPLSLRAGSRRAECGAAYEDCQGKAGVVVISPDSELLTDKKSIDNDILGDSLARPKDISNNSTDLGLGGEVVTRSLGVVQVPSNHSAYFEKIFASYELLSKSKKPRTYDSAFDSNQGIPVTLWNDNSGITVTTNFDTINPLSMAKRYPRKEKKFFSVKQP
ncbi:hypothetical protein NPIL_599101 [Nephila pilipes]|uniref:PiggyBac transposable element-derived protein domain-containing protein n=1 Tax=Nephila pilipes TaxID=299642 RepID=A0A8X6TIR3_NEPPI|nr:hypothetical protein NPIL_599101 [Nephila pilipes]